MRIIGGRYRSRVIEMPRGVDVRPTQDKVRGALFNILASRIEGANVLDLYAASGAFGLEALSRGARKAVFVDSHPRCVVAVRKNLEALNIGEDSFAVIKGDAVKALKALESLNEKFNLVFLDPPYYRRMAKNCLINIIRCDILAPIHRVIAEHHKKDEMSGIGGVLLCDERVYGDTVISIYTASESHKTVVSRTKTLCQKD